MSVAELFATSSPESFITSGREFRDGGKTREVRLLLRNPPSFSSVPKFPLYPTVLTRVLRFLNPDAAYGNEERGQRGDQGDSSEPAGIEGGSGYGGDCGNP